MAERRQDDSGGEGGVPNVLVATDLNQTLALWQDKLHI